jgi:hypothetical protein
MQNSNAKPRDHQHPEQPDNYARLHRGRPASFRTYIRDNTAEGSELTDFVLSVFRDENATNKERMDAATWLADRGFGKPTVNAATQAPGIGDFTIVIGDHDIMGNPINALPRD